MAEREERVCSVQDCERPARRGGLCWAHTKRRQRRRPLSSPLAEPYSSAWQRVLEAFRAREDCDPLDSEELARGDGRLRAALKAWEQRRERSGTGS